jgi:hypothetical protein
MRPKNAFGQPRLPRIVFAVIASATTFQLSGCWMVRAHHLANSIESDEPLSECIRNTGAEPIELASCIRHSKDKRAANACAPPAQEMAIKACLRECPVHIFRATVCRQPSRQS